MFVSKLPTTDVRNEQRENDAQGRTRGVEKAADYALNGRNGGSAASTGSRPFACQSSLSGGTTLPVALHAHRCHCPGVDAVAHTLGESTPRTPGLRSVWSVTVFGRLWTRKAIFEPLSVSGRVQRMPTPWTRALLSVSNRRVALGRNRYPDLVVQEADALPLHHTRA